MWSSSLGCTFTAFVSYISEKRVAEGKMIRSKKCIPYNTVIYSNHFGEEAFSGITTDPTRRLVRGAIPILNKLRYHKLVTKKQVAVPETVPKTRKWNQAIQRSIMTVMLLKIKKRLLTVYPLPKEVSDRTSVMKDKYRISSNLMKCMEERGKVMNLYRRKKKFCTRMKGKIMRLNREITSRIMKDDVGVNKRC